MSLNTSETHVSRSKNVIPVRLSRFLKPRRRRWSEVSASPFGLSWPYSPPSQPRLGIRIFVAAPESKPVARLSVQLPQSQFLMIRQEAPPAREIRIVQTGWKK